MPHTQPDPATVDRSDIQIRDPYVLWVPEQGRYWLFGSTDPNIWSGEATGFNTYWSTDLQSWTGPFAAFRPEESFWSHTQYWAPEVHRYRGGYIMLATFTADGHRRGTQALRADRPEGPYLPWSDGPLTPSDWECLDGTLHLEDGVPYLVFCREWKDVEDGEIHAVRLSDDLREPVGEPVRLFSASAAPWARPIPRPEFDRVYVTDGPFMHRSADGTLLMLWSSFGDQGYAMGVARSAAGITGPWSQTSEALWPTDGGHGMVFRDASGVLNLTLHTPNHTPDERLHIVPVRESDQGLSLL